jgi:hypothetical protein
MASRILLNPCNSKNPTSKKKNDPLSINHFFFTKNVKKMKKTLHIILFLCLIATLNAQTPSNLWTPQGLGVLPKNYSIISLSIVNKDVIGAVCAKD